MHLNEILNMDANSNIVSTEILKHYGIVVLVIICMLLIVALYEKFLKPAYRRYALIKIMSTDTLVTTF